ANHAPPKLITVNIGGNDILLLKKHCDAQGKLAGPCIVAKLPFYLHGYHENVVSLLGVITELGYCGPIVINSIYSPDYSNLWLSIVGSAARSSLRKAITEARSKFGADAYLADAFGAFKQEAAVFGGNACEAGLLIRLPDGTCDNHSSDAGDEL